MSDTLTLTPEQQEELWYGASGEYQQVAIEHHDEGRWSVYWAVTFKRVDSDELWQFIWEEPATEMQDIEHYDSVEAYRVEPVQSVVYRKVES